MKKLFNAIAFPALIILGISCTSQREKDIKAISGLEKQLEQEGAKPDPAKLTQLLDSYVAFAEHNAGDSLAPFYLYKAVNLSIGVNNGIRAMQLIDQTLNDFPKSGYLPETVFLKAYVYENLLSDYGKASQVYNDFMKKYPNHDLADDAEAALKYLGKSPEEMVREFEARAAQASSEE
jgi:TolA-binding protein